MINSPLLGKNVSLNLIVSAEGYRKKKVFILTNINQVPTLKILYFIVVTLLLGTQFVSSQQIAQSSSYNELYFEIAVNLSSKDPQKALHLSDSLYKVANSSKDKIKALLLSADILVKQNKRTDGIHYALKALNFAKESSDFNYLARIYGFLSTQCRTIGFYEKGKYYLNQGLSASLKFTDVSKKLPYQAMVDHEMAEYALINNDYIKGLNYIDKAIAYYNSIENSQYKSFVLANCQQLKARCYIELNNDSLALRHFKKAEINVKNAKAENSIFGALIYQGLGESYMKLMNSDSAHFYLTKALKLSEPFIDSHINEKLYESLSSYYKQSGEIDSAVVYLIKYNETVREDRNRNKQQIDKVMGYLNEEPVHGGMNNWMMILGVGVLLVIGSVGFYCYYPLKRKVKTVPKENETEPFLNTSVHIELSPEMIENFDEKLTIFTREERFLDKTLSFSMLATELGTNTKYLNYYLKHHLQTDYRTYINTLRIQYITNQLVKYPHTRKYTLAHLADISGYGSYSAFAVNFKRVMHQTPSSFIQSLK